MGGWVVHPLGWGVKGAGSETVGVGGRPWPPVSSPWKMGKVGTVPRGGDTQTQLPSPSFQVCGHPCPPPREESCVMAAQGHTLAAHKTDDCQWPICHMLWNTPGKSPRREVVRSSAGAGVVYPPFLGVISSIPQGMIFDVQPLVKSLFCPIRPSPNGSFDSEASIS